MPDQRDQANDDVRQRGDLHDQHGDHDPAPPPHVVNGGLALLIEVSFIGDFRAKQLKQGDRDVGRHADIPDVVAAAQHQRRQPDPHAGVAIVIGLRQWGR
ncbi:hypothetical protein Y900_030570 [Mycolicibacterium aromaticivorans JS19b1 = JCM 16368]|uniref:Uncharacterized protein n=1 Tax=Mycolicibacterium aromaticivorans JS19b1 = JCM 16368 TaxID=1440774 RepID=A0A064CD81_9MYCO|nr:hypothetical protein [Mycolicibacterium sp. 050158]KDE96683.1 hypothetical protein Y900_030570 [Mycolicibacterium aromaticivorans JS19b1 = JCM 16368]MDX1893409.1 hypothetical protein [Mycolicibacterium sp. 050158]